MLIAILFSFSIK